MKLLLLFCFPLIQGFIIPKNETTLGANIGERIIGGEVSRASQFPFAAAIYASYTTGNFFCGGSIINNLWILTAAQCISGAVTLTIQLGSNRLDGTDPNRVTVATSSYVVHPDYNPDTLEHDVALIRLRLPIEFNEYMTAVNLPERALNDSAPVTTIGWGQESDQNPGLMSNLHHVELVTISNTECRGVYGNQIADGMVCVVGQSNEGICTGDSGGPLIEYRTERNAVHVATAAFVSERGCESILPSGFIRTYPYVAWITGIITG